MAVATLQAIRDSFDSRAATYDDSEMHRRLADAVAGTADLGGVEDVLDVGTGTGLVLRALHARAPRLRLAGVDVSAQMLAVARAALGADALLVEADAAALPLPDASVDLVTCVTALHVIPDVTSAIAQWRRVLRPGGRAITATFARSPGREVPAAARPYPVDHGAFGSRAALEASAARHGFTILEVARWEHARDQVLIAQWVPGSSLGS